tara:strand:- start:1012 stop:1542 length:531 start_codon:yes stop_codon:yes gene_type:complete
MYTGLNENQLILPNIVDALHDYCSIQLDIDETKCKSAELLAQNIDIKRIIGEDNLNRCIEDPTGENEMTDLDKQLKALVIPALCWYTYSRLLLLFHTTFTDSGLVSAQDDGAEARNAAKSLSKECKGVAESMMLDVIEFLEEEADEDPTIDKTKFDQEKLTPRIRTFGGVEWRGSN